MSRSWQAPNILYTAMMIEMVKYYARTALCMLLLATLSFTASALDKSFYADSSKLATGKWVKIAVKESGIYQITADDVRSWGLGSDLSQIHIFGYGGAPLDEMMSDDNYADDLPQTPVVRTDSRILFYAQGPTTWGKKGKVLEQLQVQHPYANSGAYLVTNDSRFSDIDVKKATNSPAGGDPITTFVGRLYHEQEIVNPGETGRKFLGESFATTKNQTFKFHLDDRVAGQPVSVYTVFGAKTANATSTVSYSYNGTQLPVTDNDVIRKTDDLSHTHYIETSNSIKSFLLDGTDDLNYSINFSTTGTIYLARLDHITVNYSRQLKLKNGSLAFGFQDASSTRCYRLSGAGSNTRVWDVTAPYAPLQLNATPGGDGELTFSPEKSGRREFIAFDESGTYSHPDFLGEVSNQNIHGELTPDMIILTPSAYMEQANRVAAMHEKYDNFRVLVLDHEKVFNEFSSGTRDAMAYRRLCKMFYDRGVSDDGHKLGYLLLFGSGSYDNRLVGTNADALNFPGLLTWQSPASSDEDNSYTTDDLFGMLDDGSSTGFKESVNIAVGRMIVKSVSEARAVVNKLEKYVTKPIYGSWKNQVMFVADDENQGIHMVQSKDMIRIASANGADDMIHNYVFIDAFNAVSEGGARTYPDARAKMFNLLNEGVLWWNYIGHSSTQNWTGEGLLKRSDVETNLFYKRLPVLYAATCEFCRFDNSVTSSGELVYTNPNGGAIAVICAPRLALIQSNGVLSNAMARHAFSRDEQGRPRRIGDILRLAKNSISSASDNHRRYFVFGDPAMRLAYAPYTAQIKTIDGEPVDEYTMPVFSARQTIEFTGEIVDHTGKLASNFNGSIVSTLFGASDSITTHGYGDGSPIGYRERPNRLAINVDTVIDGRFTVKVIIPSEVSNNAEDDDYGQAMINLYAYDSRDTLEAKGANSNFYIHGYDADEVADTIGPDIITMGLNTPTFADGTDVNESPLLLATVSDKSGVNFSNAGIGHSMTLTLDGTISYNDLISFYTPQYADEGTLGSITYQLNDLTAGLHSLRLRVWDVYNNVSEKTITFNVVNGLTPEIADVYCAANPASVETSFYVKHNRPDAVVSVSIEVYDLMGRRVWSATQSGRSDMYTSTPITWDLTDAGGRRVPRGIYVYRATISTDGVKEATKAKKLAVTGE